VRLKIDRVPAPAKYLAKCIRCNAAWIVFLDVLVQIGNCIQLRRLSKLDIATESGSFTSFRKSLSRSPPYFLVYSSFKSSICFGLSFERSSLKSLYEPFWSTTYYACDRRDPACRPAKQRYSRLLRSLSLILYDRASPPEAWRIVHRVQTAPAHPQNIAGIELSLFQRMIQPSNERRRSNISLS